MIDHSEKLLFKIIIIGDAGVGKSCLLMKYTTEEFRTEYNVTIGVEFGSKIVSLDENTKVKLQIWDTAGQESFRSLIKSFYKNATAVFLVYDITKKETFENLDEWLEETKQNNEKMEKDLIFVLIGNKNDLEDQREVSYEQAYSYMQERNFHLFFETSASTGKNIETAFTETAKLTFMNYINAKIRKNTIRETINLSDPARDEFQIDENILHLENRNRPFCINKTGNCCS